MNSPRALQVLLAVLAFALIVRIWVWSPILTHGDSMLPTFRSGQVTVVNKLAYWRQGPRRGDVVVLSIGDQFYTKRIVGLPGENVSMREGVLYINGNPLPEPYVTNSTALTVKPGRLQRGSYLVLGDNRAATILLVVRQDRIVGHVQ